MMRFTGITFASDFNKRTNQNFEQAQKYVDSETIRWMEPYTPKDTGRQIDIGATGTRIGSGIIQYNSSIARRNYYTNAGRGKQGMTKHNSHNYKCLRGKLWLERMKPDHKEDILKGLKKFR